MITFQDYLYEAFGFSYPFTIDGWGYTYEFKHNGKNIEVYFDPYAKNAYDISFMVEGVGFIRDDNTFDKDPIKLFSTIGAIIKHFISKNEVKAFKFSNTLSKSFKLYDAFARRMAKELNGSIKIEKDEPTIKLYDNPNHFIWIITL